MIINQTLDANRALNFYTCNNAIFLTHFFIDIAIEQKLSNTDVVATPLDYQLNIFHSSNHFPNTYTHLK